MTIFFITVVFTLNIGTTAARATTKRINTHHIVTIRPATTYKCSLGPETVYNTSTGRGRSKENSIMDTTNRNISNRGTPGG